MEKNTTGIKKRLHYWSGIILTVFTLLHLSNHLFSLKSPEAHLEVTRTLPYVYRNPFAESMLMLAVIVQIVTGLQLLKSIPKPLSFMEKIRRYSGIYLAGFLFVHVSAIWTGRLLLKLDTNFYFGALGFNQHPYYFFFFPYYFLAIAAFCSHLAVVHYNKMQNFVGEKKARQHFYVVIFAGLIIGCLIAWGFSNGFKGVEIPGPYQYLPKI